VTTHINIGLTERLMARYQFFPVAPLIDYCGGTLTILSRDETMNAALRPLTVVGPAAIATPGNSMGGGRNERGTQTGVSPP